MSGLLLSILEILSCVAMMGCVCYLVIFAVRGFGSATVSNFNNKKIVLFVAVFFFALFLFRPHEETFQGLDGSAYRLMAEAMMNGRPFQGVDSVLLEIPEDLRAYVLLNPQEQGRLTRDRSFEIASLKTGNTKPFFYPLLPLCMNGLDNLLPGNARDLFVPLLGFVFAFAILLSGIRIGGVIPGTLVSLMLLTGSPLIVWLLRGAYLETISGILISMALIPWIVSTTKPLKLSCIQFFAMGLAVSFHPVMIVLALPLSGIMIIEGADSFKRLFLFTGSFLVGLMPIFLLTLFIATPYGEMSLGNLKHTLIYSSSIRPTIAAVVLLGMMIVVLQVGKKWLLPRISLAGWRNNVLSGILLVLWVLPVLLAVKYWEQGQGRVVLAGFCEMLDGLQPPFGSVILLLCMIVLFSRNTLREKMCLTFLFMSLPLFLYLKGAEHMGLWSQRRLIASFVIVITCCMPTAVTLVSRALQPGLMRIGRYVGVLLLVMFVGAYNAVRWPAPYLICYEKGAGAWVKHVTEIIGNRLAFFDYHPFSVPFAVQPGSRVLGLSEFGKDKLPGMIKWLEEKAANEEVLLVSAYSNPGLEDNIVLKDIARETGRFEIAHSKTVLPAERRWRNVDLSIMRVIPVSSADHVVLCKTFDDGPLALRGSWGKGRPIKVDGKMLPARWSREGSGVIGPVPLPGQSVRVSIEGAADRDDGIEGQILRIRPPWDGKTLSLAVSNDFTRVSGVLSKGGDQKDGGKRTGIYSICAEKPYDPGKVGIKGYENDLGARIHMIRIEAASGGVDTNEKKEKM